MSEKSITVNVGLTEARAIDSFVTRGDWSQLAPQDRARAYVQVCAQHGLNAMSQPFAFLKLNGKEVLYATRGATDQLAAKHSITREIIDGPKVIDIAGTKVAYCVARATLPTGRAETATATLPVQDPVNLYMKLETKAKRRATIALLGLAMLDETELATIPDRAQGDAPQPSRDDLERAVVEMQEPKALPELAALGIEQSDPRTAPTQPAPAQSVDDLVADIEVQVCRCGSVTELANLWRAVRAEVGALPKAGQTRAWKLVGQRAEAIGATAAEVRAEVQRRDTPPRGDGPRGGTPTPAAPANTDARGEGHNGGAAQGAQASADAWRESAEGIVAHVARISAARHLESSARQHLRDVPEVLRLHAVHVYAGRLQRLSHDGSSSLAWDECVHRAETWLREGPRVAVLPERVRPAARATLAAGGAR